MGRKMKNIVALLVILGLIYWHRQVHSVSPRYYSHFGAQWPALPPCCLRLEHTVTSMNPRLAYDDVANVFSCGGSTHRISHPLLGARTFNSQEKINIIK